jgi:CheY-like chemotaxis protein
MKRYLEPATEFAATNHELQLGEHRYATRLRGLTESPPAGKWPTTSLAPVGHRPRLVIADDDPVVQSILGMSLGREFEVVGVAADGEEAVELARVHQPDAALIDVVMPRGGGLRAVRGILEVAPDTAVVMLSGHRSHGLVRELLQAGAISYRRKGVSPHILAKALTESIKVHIAERQGSARRIIASYCLDLDRRSRRRIHDVGQAGGGLDP